MTRSRKSDNLQSSGVHKKRRLGIFGAIRQWLTLSRRYSEVLFRDKFNLFILFAQAPIVAFLTFLVMGDDQSARHCLFGFGVGFDLVWHFGFGAGNHS